jgi:hypothetical protein
MILKVLGLSMFSQLSINTVDPTGREFTTLSG